MLELGIGEEDRLGAGGHQELGVGNLGGALATQLLLDFVIDIIRDLQVELIFEGLRNLS